MPEGLNEIIAVDMGCVGHGLECKETQVSICAKDSSGPSDYALTTRLINAAKARAWTTPWMYIHPTVLTWTLRSAAA